LVRCRNISTQSQICIAMSYADLG